MPCLLRERFSLLASRNNNRFRVIIRQKYTNFTLQARARDYPTPESPIIFSPPSEFNCAFINYLAIDRHYLYNMINCRY